MSTEHKPDPRFGEFMENGSEAFLRGRSNGRNIIKMAAATAIAVVGFVAVGTSLDVGGNLLDTTAKKVVEYTTSFDAKAEAHKQGALDKANNLMQAALDSGAAPGGPETTMCWSTLDIPGLKMAAAAGKTFSGHELSFVELHVTTKAQLDSNYDQHAKRWEERGQEARWAKPECKPYEQVIKDWQTKMGEIKAGHQAFMEANGGQLKIHYRYQPGDTRPTMG